MTGKGRGRVKRRSPPSLGNILSLSGPQHGENFGYTILGAIGLLVFVGVKTFHTASPPIAAVHFDPEDRRVDWAADIRARILASVVIVPPAPTSRAKTLG